MDKEGKGGWTPGTSDTVDASDSIGTISACYERGTAPFFGLNHCSDWRALQERKNILNVLSSYVHVLFVLRDSIRCIDPPAMGLLLDLTACVFVDVEVLDQV